MKKLVMILVSALMASSVVLAQNRAPVSAEEMAKKQTERMTESLSLSDSQKSKIEAINLKYAKKHEESRQKTQAEREAKRAEMGKLHEEKEAELKAVLTTEQFKQYQEKQKKGKKEGYKKGDKAKKGKIKN